MEDYVERATEGIFRLDTSFDKLRMSGLFTPVVQVYD